MEQEEGQELKSEIKERSLFEDLLGDLINLDRGLPATIVGMIKSPAQVIDSYFDHSDRYVNPFRYTIFILAITTAITTIFIDYNDVMRAAMEAGAQSTNANPEENMEIIEQETGLDITGYMDSVREFSVMLISKFNQLLYIIVLAPILAFFSRLFFKKSKPKFKHHYVMYLYTLTTFSVFSLLFIPLMKMEISITLFTLISFFLMLFIVMYVQSSYLNLRGFKSFFMMFLSYSIAYVVYTFTTAFIQLIGGFILFTTQG